jgi:hypothetical protein
VVRTRPGAGSAAPGWATPARAPAPASPGSPAPHRE